jgi:hypothetical protein
MSISHTTAMAILSIYISHHSQLDASAIWSADSLSIAALPAAACQCLCPMSYIPSASVAVAPCSLDLLSTVYSTRPIPLPLGTEALTHGPRHTICDTTSSHQQADLHVLLGLGAGVPSSTSHGSSNLGVVWSPNSKDPCSSLWSFAFAFCVVSLGRPHPSELRDPIRRRGANAQQLQASQLPFDVA